MQYLFIVLYSYIFVQNKLQALQQNKLSTCKLQKVILQNFYITKIDTIKKLQWKRKIWNRQVNEAQN